MTNSHVMYQQFLKIFPLSLRQKLYAAGILYEELQEIRLRVGQPLCVRSNGHEWYMQQDGSMTRDCALAMRITEQEIKEMMQLISGYSLYAYEEELRQGFITIVGGHRIGVAGKIIAENGYVKGVRHISSLNVRLAHQVLGCARGLLPRLLVCGQVCSTLILSPPGCGKTTLLRDLIRMVSDGSAYARGVDVGVVDERSELAGCYQGIPQNDVGMRTDVLDCCPKVEGMMRLLRSMAPSVLAVDEIGSHEDVQALEQVHNSGCRLLATVHGESFDGLWDKTLMKTVLEKQLFQRFVILQAGTYGKIARVCDAEGRNIS